jgi:hypothetical protein
MFATFETGLHPLRIIGPRPVHSVFQVESLILSVANRGGERESGLTLGYHGLELDYLEFPSCPHIAG